MVRINLINPKKLSDQHLIAEYNEILMLVGHLKKNGFKKENCPEKYCLGKGHITFFKNKLAYLNKRHHLIKEEMKKRDFKTNKNLDLSEIDKSLIKDWEPKKEDFKIIKQRLKEKINFKPRYYRYYSKNVEQKFLIGLLNLP